MFRSNSGEDLRTSDFILGVDVQISERRWQVIACIHSQRRGVDFEGSHGTGHERREHLVAHVEVSNNGKLSQIGRQNAEVVGSTGVVR